MQKVKETEDLIMKKDKEMTDLVMLKVKEMVDKIRVTDTTEKVTAIIFVMLAHTHAVSLK